MFLFRELQAIFADENVLSFYACTKIVGKPIQIIGEQIELFGIGLALQKKESTLTSKISNYIRIYREYNFVEDLTAKWQSKQCQVKNVITIKEADFRSFGGAFMMLFIGVSVSVVILVLECCLSMARIKSYAVNNVHDET